MAATVGFIAVFALLFFGVPIAVGMGLVGFVGLTWLSGAGAAGVTLTQIATDTAMNETLSVLPLFILMGNLINRAGLSKRLYDASNAFVGHRRGGLSLATIMASGGFSAVCGSSLATAATMAKIAMPAMRRFGYRDSLAAGSVAAGGTLGILIPPSTILIIYGNLTETDIGKLFIAGIIPGLLGVGLYMLAVSAITRARPDAGPPGERTPWPARLHSLFAIGGILGLFLLVMGGIYFGIFTPTEAAGIGAAGAFLSALRQRIGWRGIVEVLIDSGRTTAVLLVLLIGAMLFSRFINLIGLPTALVGWIDGLGLAPVAVIFLLIGIYLILGCILESLSMLLLTVPVFLPLVLGLGFDPVWFGIIVVVVIEISLITPPVGINVFVLKSVIPDVSTREIFKGVAPFVAVDIVRVALLVLFPALVLFLPSLM